MRASLVLMFFAVVEMVAFAFSLDGLHGVFHHWYASVFFALSALWFAALAVYGLKSHRKDRVPTSTDGREHR